ncbi:MAG: quinone-dependent dihydroorotate dehydrogenase [Bacteriovoracaceae bacterium]|nr:quinone-dependent dihydroorotate dehydrogenase [Bacteriovoracaceae bacterium]
MNTYPILRKGLFLLPPETAHNLTLEMAHLFPQLAAGWQFSDKKELNCQVGKTEWRSPVGLAAGLDKNAVALDFFSRLGFGSMECGTITVNPQIGNPKPRMFRYSEEFSLRNSMGFPNNGMKECAEKLKTRPTSFPVGVNIGKSKNSNPDEALEEYAQLYTTLAPLSDWVVVNISSPNTAGLRDLQQEDWLKKLFETLLPLKSKLGKEIFVKLAPDLEDETLRHLTTVLADLGADGLVATNTTHMPERGVGGVSGRLLRVKGHQKRRVVLEVARDRHLPLVGVGGFEDMNDVLAWWASGGEAFQIYTSFIYQGPQILRDIESHILGFLTRAKLQTLQTFFSLEPRERQKLIAAFGR